MHAPQLRRGRRRALAAAPSALLQQSLGLFSLALLAVSVTAQGPADGSSFDGNDAALAQLKLSNSSLQLSVQQVRPNTFSLAAAESSTLRSLRSSH